MERSTDDRLREAVFLVWHRLVWPSMLCVVLAWMLLYGYWRPWILEHLVTVYGMLVDSNPPDYHYQWPDAEMYFVRRMWPLVWRLALFLFSTWVVCRWVILPELVRWDHRRLAQANPKPQVPIDSSDS